MHAAKRRRRWFQFSLRTLLVFFLICGVTMWIAVEMREAEKQREVVAAIRSKGGAVFYDYQWKNDMYDVRVKPPGPTWLRKFVGRDFLSNVRYVRLADTSLATHARQLQRLRGLEELRLHGGATTDSSLIQLKEFTNLRVLSLTGTGVTDAGLKHLQTLTNLRRLCLYGTAVTDEGLEHLKALTSLEWLSLGATQVTDTGIKDLSKALPRCRIFP